ncbi:MAG TPA: aminotransferase class I/II-fold pyridoxal phosphate-dependent enzyme [Solirubrobacteraceae bacterium]|nr:aminotransferase class I/II-fold pyridoxal phosphate-dependent enzyme [Solirubrobacteraceae bacterium]
MQLNPLIEELGTYPFAQLTDARRRAQAQGTELIDFGVGEPREETPAFIRRALTQAVEDEPVSTYPQAAGLPELRRAIAGWLDRRFGVRLDPGIEILPTLGSKEAIFHLAQALIGAGSERDLVAVTTPGYPVPARGALFAGARVLELPLDPAAGWLPDLSQLDARAWRRLALLWVNHPGNPTGAVAPRAFYEELAARCREHGVVLASDEAYSEIWLAGEPPPSVLQVSDPTHVLAFHSLSKRSSMPGYRSGFVAGDPLLIAALKQVRPSIGVAPQTFVQRASIAAWGDERHVEETRARYRAKRELLLPAVRAAGFDPVGGEATFFLWCRAPAGESAEGCAERLLGHGVVVAPGTFFGPAGEGHVRIALVPTLAECERAAQILTGLGR